MIEVVVQLKEVSQAIEYKEVINFYQKGDLLCIQMSNGKVHKYPIHDVFRIIQDFGYKSDRK